MVMEAFGPTTGAVAATCCALTALLLAGRFLGRGSSRLLGLACTFTFAALAITAEALLGAPEVAAAWLWALAAGGLPAGLALSAWGGTRAHRRRLADPGLRRGRAVARGLALTAAVAGALAGAIVAADARLPDAGRGALSVALLPLALGAFAVLLRRGRRGDLERRVLLVGGAAPVVLALAALGGSAADAARLVQLVSVAVLLCALLLELTRLAAAGGAAGALDPLTGARTRSAALAAAEDLHAARAPREPLAVGLVALDRLGQVNQAFGQLAGDAVLRNVTELLESALRDEDVVGRWGGDVFVIVLPGTGEDGARLALERAIDTVRETPLGTWAHELRLTATAGLAVVGPGERAVDLALAQADAALERGQAAGGDRVVSPRGDGGPAPLAPRRRAAAGPRAA